jgi:CBS domain-containing protein
MKISSPISALLNQKGHTVHSVSPDLYVLDAIHLMAERDVGALVVLAGERVVGIISERDYTRNVILKGRSSRETRVGEIIMNSVLTASPDDSVEECMRVMTQHRVRHLPVLHEEKLVGIISIGDLVNWTISAQNAAIEQLESYIAGR